VEVFGYPDLVEIGAITFNFNSEHLSVSVDPDSDTLMWRSGSIFPLHEEQVRKNPEFRNNYFV